MHCQFIPYEAAYDHDIRQLEQSALQGTAIQLEMLKDHFLDRSAVFKLYYPCVAVGEDGKLVAVSAAARVPLTVNGETFYAGVVYDVKVQHQYRNQGIGRGMTKHIYKAFFEPHGLTRNFTTLKQSNSPVFRLAAKVAPQTWSYPFVYLTIPTSARIKNPLVFKGEEQRLRISLSEDLPACHTDLPGGLGYFQTFKLYRLRIRHLPFLWKIGMALLKKLGPVTYAHLPCEGETMSFATLYNHNPSNLDRLNDVLEELQQNGIGYLLVCCCKNDKIYRALKKYSMNTYGYSILSDFLLGKEDRVTLDVRCL